MIDIKSHVMDYQKIDISAQVFTNMSLEHQELVLLNFGKLRNFNLEAILLLLSHIQISIFTPQLLHTDYSWQGSQLDPIFRLVSFFRT